MSTPETPTVEAPVNVVAPSDSAPDAESAVQTPASPSPAPVETPQPASPPAAESADPVRVERAFRTRSDDDVPFGHFADVVSGEHAGRYGVYTSTAHFGRDGIPTRVIVRTRDDRDEFITVAYDAIRPSRPGKR